MVRAQCRYIMTSHRPAGNDSCRSFSCRVPFCPSPLFDVSDTGDGNRLSSYMRSSRRATRHRENGSERLFSFLNSKPHEV